MNREVADVRTLFFALSLTALTTGSLALSGCGSDTVDPVDASTPRDGGVTTTDSGMTVISGATVYAQNCAVCHGADGSGSASVPNATPLTSAPVQALGQSNIEAIVTNGQSASMPAFGGVLSAAEISAVAEFVLTL